jgi:multidrug efflux pump subunit AcrA (membrane-fusion protein)
MCRGLGRCEFDREMSRRIGGGRFLTPALGLISVAAIAAAIAAIGPASAKEAPETTAAAQRGVIQKTVSGSGSLQPARQTSLGFANPGTVSHLYVKEGDHVHKGQLLATLDSATARRGLEQARAQLASAEAGLASARAGSSSNPNSPAEASSSSDESSASHAASVASAKASVNRDDPRFQAASQKCQQFLQPPSPSQGPTSTSPG